MATSQESSEKKIACSVLERHHSTLSQSLTSQYTVIRICQILYSKKFITERTLNRVESLDTALEDKREFLLAAVKTAVYIIYRKLHELATVLDHFKETKSVAKDIISDYNKAIQKAAKEALKKNTVNLTKAISASRNAFDDIVLACEQEDLISSDFKCNLFDISNGGIHVRCNQLISYIQTLVDLQPTHLDTFLCVLVKNEGTLGNAVAESVANDYGCPLTKYAAIRGGATSVISTDDNVEEMVPQYADQMSNEDRASDILRTHYSTLSQSLKDPVNIARLLHGENVISEDAVTQIDSADISNRTTVLLGSVRRAIHANHQHLNKFGRALQQLTAGNERVGQDILKDYDKAFSVKNEFPVPHEMEEEFTGIKVKFGIMCTKIKKTLETNNVSLEDMKCCCKFTYTNLSHQVESCQTVEDVLMFVAKKCTLIKIRLLKELVDFCNVAEAKQHLQDYQEAIDNFSQKMRARFPLNQSLLPDGTPHPLCGETITFVMKWNPENVSLDDIENLQTYAFGSLFENVNVIKMEPINSVIITCSFPFELTCLLIAEAMKNLKLLKKKELLKLTIGYCTIWNIRDEEVKDKQNEDNKEEMNEETVGDNSDIADQQRDTESELLGQTDETIEELQQPLQAKEDTLLDKQMLKQQNKAMIMEIETLKYQLESKEERVIEATREMDMLQDKLLEKDKQLLKEQLSVEIKQEMLEGKILSLSDQSRKREEEIKQLSTRNEKLLVPRALRESPLKVKDIPSPNPNLKKLMAGATKIIELKEREITKRKATLYKYHNYKEVCQICFRKNRICTERPSQGTPWQCPIHKGEWMMTLVADESHETKTEVKPLPFRGKCSRLCKYSNECKEKSCKYPHTMRELDLWKEEDFIVQAVMNPREDPPDGWNWTLEPTLCLHFTNRGTCPHGRDCKSPHSDAELKALRKLRKTIIERSPQTYPWISDAVKESMSCDSIPEKLLTLHGKCKNQLPKGDPRGELSSLIHRALTQLVIEETKSLKLPKDDPLADRTSHSYANSFGDELGMLSYKLVSLVDTECEYKHFTLNDTADSRQYLGFLKSNTCLITDGPGDSIYMYCIILKLFCNQLAHRNYLVTSPVGEIFQYGIPSFVMVMINYGVAIVHELIKMLKVKCGSEPSNEDQIKAIEGHYGNIQCIKQDYDLFCDDYRLSKEHYRSLEKVERTKQVLHQLIDQVNETNAEEIATELAAKYHIK